MQTQEAIKDYLLTKKSVTKLEITQFLLQNKFFITVSYLAKEFNMSENNFLIYIHELKRDVASLAIDSVAIITQQRFVKIEADDDSSIDCYYRLFGLYCTESTNYSIMAALLDNQITSILALSRQTNYSASYLYTRMKTINSFLSLYGIAIRFSQAGKKLVTGSEFQIQYCILDVYWNIFSNTSRPFQKESEETVAYMLNRYFKKGMLASLNGGLMDKLYLLLKICTTNFPYTSRKEIQQVIHEHPDSLVFLDPAIDLLHGDIPLSDEQRIILNVLVRLSLPKIESDQGNQKQYELLLEKPMPSLLYSKLLVEKFGEAFNLTIPENKKTMHILNLLRNKLYNEYFCEKQPNTPLPSFSLYKERQSFLTIKEQIKQFYLDFRQTYHHLLPKRLEKENIDWIVEDLFHLLDRYKSTRPIIIGINYTRDYYVSEDLIGKIEQIYASEHLALKKRFMETCDIVISDCPLPNLPKQIKRIYLLNETVELDDWEMIISKIGTYIFEIRAQSLR